MSLHEKLQYRKSKVSHKISQHNQNLIIKKEEEKQKEKNEEAEKLKTELEAKAEAKKLKNQRKYQKKN